MNHRVSGRAIVSTLFALATTGSFACSSNVGFISPSLVAGDGSMPLGDPTDAGATGDDGPATSDGTGTGGPASGGGIAPAGSGGAAGANPHPQGGTTGSGGVAATGGAIGSGGARASGGTTGTMTGSGGAVASGGTTSTAGSGGTRPPGSGGMTASSGGKVGSGGTGTGGQVAPPPPAGCPDAAPSSATIYYVCDCGSGADSDCVAGKDSNDGKSASTPWQTFEKGRTQFSSLKAGDRLEFCQGGSFTAGKATWVNSNCKADNRCVVTSYKAPWASGNEARPHIHSPSGQNGFDFSDPQSKHEEGYVFAGLELEGSGTDWGFFFYADVDDVLICDSYIHNFDIGAHLVANDPDGNTHNENIVLRDSIINDNPGQGFLGGDNGLVLERNHFENNGAARASLNHNVYIGEEGVSNITIRNNELYRAAMMNGQCQGTSLVVHGLIDGLLIEGNYIHEDIGAASQGCWGIAVAPAYSTSEKFTNVTIRGNTVQDVGNMSIGVASCQGCTIENNLVINHQAINDVAIAAPCSDRSSDDATNDKVTIRNNSLLIDVGRGIGLTQEGTGNAVVNNAIYSAGGGNGGVACLILDLPGSAYSEVDYNDCFMNGKGEWVLGKGSLDSWSKSSGFDKHSTSANPGYKTIVSPYDLSPSAGSPLLNSADPMNCPATNFSGVARSGTPNVGAY